MTEGRSDRENPQDWAHLGRIVRGERERREFTQRRAVREANLSMSKSQFSRCENGERPFKRHEVESILDNLGATDEVKQTAEKLLKSIYDDDPDPRPRYGRLSKALLTGAVIVTVTGLIVGWIVISNAAGDEPEGVKFDDCKIPQVESPPPPPEPSDTPRIVVGKGAAGTATLHRDQGTVEITDDARDGCSVIVLVKVDGRLIAVRANTKGKTGPGKPPQVKTVGPVSANAVVELRVCIGEVSKKGEYLYNENDCTPWTRS